MLQALPLPGFNQGVLCRLNRFALRTSKVTFHHRGVWSKYAGPREGFTLKLPLRFQWMQMPSISSLVNKRCFHFYWGPVPLRTTSPQAHNYKPLIQYFNTLIPFHYSPAPRYRSLLLNSSPTCLVFKSSRHPHQQIIQTGESPVSVSFGPVSFPLSEEGDQVAENGSRLWGGVRGRGVCRTAISYFQCPS